MYSWDLQSCSQGVDERRFHIRSRSFGYCLAFGCWSVHIAGLGVSVCMCGFAQSDCL
jgi:hypothetical protein